MIQRCCLPTTIAGLLLLSLSAVAHHSLDEAYERDSSIVLTGTVTRMSWVNPHAILVLRVEDAAGSVVEWIVEMDPPNVLRRGGWSEAAIADGQVVTVEGFRTLDGTARTYAKTVTLPGGEILAASSDGSWMWAPVRN